MDRDVEVWLVDMIGEPVLPRSVMLWAVPRQGEFVIPKEDGPSYRVLFVYHLGAGAIHVQVVEEPPVKWAFDRG